MNDDRYDSMGKLLLRLTLGFTILLHGVAKLIGGVDGIAGMLSGSGLPGFIAYGVYLGEVVGPVLLIVGWYARIGAGLIAINMLFAIGLAHTAEVFALGQQGGWAIELQAMFLFSAIALVLMGPGRYGVNLK